ncbi:MAG: nucleotide sugar dehydrogenase [Pseudohongiellaceae bacterium]
MNIAEPPIGSIAQSVAEPFADLFNRISSREAHVTVIGQGYVGLPLAVGFAAAGFEVSGLDTNNRVVNNLNSGKSSTPDVADSELAELQGTGKYQATVDFSVLSGSDVILVCVPTPLRKSKDPDISFILATAERMVENLRRGQLIILESTTYPGTTEELLLPMLESTGFKAGKDFFLAFSPERIDPGNPNYGVRDIPKVTGGVTAECTKLAALLYRQIVKKVVEVASPRVAELSKLYENVFRSVNIALANEFALMCRHLGVNSREVIDAAASKPFGFMAFYPGPGIGGHCIPVDPSYLAWKMRFNNYQARFIPLAEEINQAMPAHVVKLVGDALNQRKLCINGARITALGVAYKKNVGDIRESPALQIISMLVRKGAIVRYADPHVPSVEIDGSVLRRIQATDNELKTSDCVLILTDHTSFDYQNIIDNCALIVDTRDATWGMESKPDQVVRI